MNLGAILTKHKLINPAQLAEALAEQKRSGSRLGDILVAGGALNYYSLYQAIAGQRSIQFVDLLKDPPDAELLTGAGPEEYLRHQAMPWRREADGKLAVAIADYGDGTLAWCEERFGGNVRFVFTSPLDIRRSVESHFGAAMESASRLALWQHSPNASARSTMAASQRRYLIAALLFCLAMAVFFPMPSLLVFFAFCHITYAFMMIFKTAVFMAGARERVTYWLPKLARLDERSLPVYTILVPMHRETESLPGMLEAIRRLDYPAAKLDVKLVLEADDEATIRAALALKPRYQFEMIRVPPNAPRTKPKACNYALRYARGEYICVFDADDRPEPEQLKKAVIAFRESPQDVVCLQARLNYYNTHDNWLTRCFSLEYTMLFNHMLHGLERLGIPIPLGGTSNHFSLARLRELGEWDPYNVTEDADLGTRLSARGFKTRMLDSYTLEEAPNTVGAWLRQRSRWIKGYMQTWLVHMRDPRALYRTLGFRGFFGFQCFIGLSCFTFLTGPLVWLCSFAWMMASAAVPAWLVALTLANLALNVITHAGAGLYSLRHYRSERPAMAAGALLYPLYLFLHSIASYKSLWQLATHPHFWEKTRHGLARRVEMPFFGGKTVDKPPVSGLEQPLISPSEDPYESAQLAEIRQKAR